DRPLSICVVPERIYERAAAAKSEARLADGLHLAVENLREEASGSGTVAVMGGLHRNGGSGCRAFEARQIEDRRLDAARRLLENDVHDGAAGRLHEDAALDLG